MCGWRIVSYGGMEMLLTESGFKVFFVGGLVAKISRRVH